MRFTLLIFFLFIFCNIITAQEIEHNVKITHIDSTESYYFIKGKIKNEKRMKILIISEKDTTVTGNVKIKRKTTYLLELSNYLSDERINELPAKPLGTLFLKEEGYIIWDGTTSLPFKSPDIKSIYYIKRD
jgi:hypothetical protein